jgi:peptide-methionine (S)-S-oxide reductase
VVDSSEGASGPVYFVLGEGEPRVPGLDAAVLGLSLDGAAATKTFLVAASDAFGARSDDNLVRVPGDQAPPGLEAGDTVRMGDGRAAVVTSVSAAEVIVDANHEFAGQDITLSVTLVAHTPASSLQRATFGLGCFWGPELAFQRVPGVMGSSVGYANGKVPNPTYEAVCSGATGHAECVQLAFDPAAVSYEALLQLFWERHDPTQLNRQGNDVGTQYRSGVYAHDAAQLAVAQASAAAEAAKRPGGKVATEVVMLDKYYRAEEYHQSYLAKGGRNGRAQSPAKMCNDPIRCVARAGHAMCAVRIGISRADARNAAAPCVAQLLRVNAACVSSHARHSIAGVRVASREQRGAQLRRNAVAQRARRLLRGAHAAQQPHVARRAAHGHILIIAVVCVCQRCIANACIHARG